MQIYVSSSTGKDPGDGGFVAGTAGSSATPYRTVAVAMSKLRGGEADWALFKCGDTWTDDPFGASLSNGDLNQVPIGRAGGALATTEPMVLTSYGSGARPKFNIHPTGSGVVIGSHGPPASNLQRLAIIGLEFNDYKRDPSDASFTAAVSAGEPGCIGFGNSFDFLLIEDCKFSFYVLNINVEPIESGNYTGTGFYFRRNLVLDAYPGRARSQGMFMANLAANGWLIEENIFDLNGYNTTLSQAVTVTVTSGTPGNVSFVISLTSGNFTPPNGSTVVFANTLGSITAGTLYTTLGLSGNTFQISTDGVTPINLTSSGTNTCYWVDPSANGGNRNCYIAQHGTNGKGIVRGNITSRSSSDGFQVRTGGDIYNNLFAYNASFAVKVGSSSQSDTLVITYANIYDNAIVNTTKLQTVPTATGDGSGIGINNLVPGTIAIGPNNVISQGQGTSASAIDFDVAVVAGQASGNAIFSYAIGAVSDGTGGVVSDNGIGFTITSGGSGYADSTGQSEPWHFVSTTTNGSGTNLLLWVSVNASGVVTSVVPAWTAGAPAQGYAIGDTFGLTPGTGNMPAGGSGFSATINKVGTTTTGSLGPNTVDLAGTQPYPAGWSDPTRNVDSYDSSVLGGPGTFAHFIGLARLQSRQNWNSQLTADVVVDWIQGGFGLNSMYGNFMAHH